MSNNLTPPSFDDMMRVADEIYELQKDISMLDLEIKTREAQIILDAVANSQGKPPSMEYLKSTVKITGLSGELIPKRELLADLEARLEKAKMTFQVYRNMVDIYKSNSFHQGQSV